MIGQAMSLFDGQNVNKGDICRYLWKELQAGSCFLWSGSQSLSDALNCQGNAPPKECLTFFADKVTDVAFPCVISLAFATATDNL